MSIIEGSKPPTTKMGSNVKSVGFLVLAMLLRSDLAFVPSSNMGQAAGYTHTLH
jgi:hypothetical protein